MVTGANAVQAAGRDSLDLHLSKHMYVAAQRALTKLGGPLTPRCLDRFLIDPDCLRYPTAIAYDDGPLEPHQFAEPVIELKEGRHQCRLHIRPCFRGDEDAVTLLVAYMVAPINYGTLVTPAMCEAYGANLVDMSKEEYYGALCACVDCHMM